MVGSINANETSANTFEAYKAKAIATADNGTSTPSSTSASGAPSGTASGTPAKSSGAAVGQMAALNVQIAGAIGTAFFGAVLGLML